MRTLLLADDSVTVQRVIALTFAEEQIQVVTVADGQQALEKMAAQKPDIVLAGTTLPQVSGYELARFIRNKPELKGVPVLLLSGAFETVDEARLASSGANGFIEKPVEPTVVIGRVKELLGLKAETKPPAAGRLVTSAEPPAAKQLPVATPPRAVTSTKGTPSRWQQLRDQTGLDPDTRSVEDASTRSDDYLDTLDAAFDSLDQQLSGRTPKKGQRNPAGPLGPGGGAPDPRSPGRRPPAPAAQAGNQVFEVDDEWFGSSESPAAVEARARRREIVEDLQDPDIRPQSPAPRPDPIYEVDDEWFVEGDKVKAEQLVERQHLAAEMGIHDVELPEAPTRDLGLEDLKQIVAETPAAASAPAVVAPPAPPPASPPPPVPAASHPAAIAPLPKVAKAPPPAPPAAPATTAAPVALVQRGSTPVADDFAALLAFEQGERTEPPMPASAAVNVVAPEVTGEMLEEIAARVAERLTVSNFGTQLTEAMTSTMRHSVHDAVTAVVRPIVSETSERIVREVVSAAAERVLRDVASHAVDRTAPGAVSQAVERVVPGVVLHAAERLIKEAVGPAVDRVARDIVLEASERLVREEIERIRSRQKS